MATGKKVNRALATSIPTVRGLREMVKPFGKASHGGEWSRELVGEFGVGSDNIDR